MSGYVFKPFTKDSTPHAQLQEWAEHYKVKLKWEDVTIQQDGITRITSYPIIQGHHYSDFSATGNALRYSHYGAAEKIINSKGTLDEAKERTEEPGVSRL